MAERNQNVDLMRIVLMLMIVGHHCVINGFGLQQRLVNQSLTDNYSIFLSALNSFCVIGVNVFFLISGYYGIRCSKTKLISLVFDTYLYNSILLGIAAASGLVPIDFSFAENLLIPFHKYWFILVYLMLFVFSDFLNNVFVGLEKKKVKVLYGFSFFLICMYGFLFKADWLGIVKGYSLTFAVFLYITGRVISKYNFFRNGKIVSYRLNFILWMFFSVMTFVNVWSLIVLEKPKQAWDAFAYNSPFIFLSSVFFLCFFLNMPRLKVNFSRFAPYILPVYFIHTSVFFAFYRNKPLQFFSKESFVFQFLFWIIYVICIFILCIVIDFVKKKTIGRVQPFLEKKVLDWID